MKIARVCQGKRRCLNISSPTDECLILSTEKCKIGLIQLTTQVVEWKASMRVAIISDIHGNLEALEKTSEIIEAKDIDDIICLGDLVGYGANPNECIDYVDRRTKKVLLGNHDQAAFDLKQTEYFNTYARRAAHWTHDVLTQEHNQYLQSLPYALTETELTFVHSSPFEPEEWHYIFSNREASRNFNHFKTSLCFVGHSHVPGVYCEDQRTREIKKGLRYLINVGSIGQPRDGDWRLSFGIFDTESWSYKNVRSEYDVESAADKILKAGLPRFLAERLFRGV